jgi:hypothetical protein
VAMAFEPRFAMVLVPEFQVKNTHYDLLKEGHRCFTPV